MSLTTLCRLCICPFHNCKQLFDDSGQCNDAYDIASKYFDPMLLNPGQEFNIPVICLECWQHISDFYAFQQTVYAAQTKLEDAKQIVSVVKLEEEEIPDETPFINHDEQSIVPFKEELKDEVHMSDVRDTFDAIDENPFCSDDELPLIKSFTRAGKKKRQTVKKRKTPPKKRGITRSKKDNKPAIDIKNDSMFKTEPSDDPNSSSNNDKTDNQNANKTSSEKSNSIQPKIKENDAVIAAWKSELDCEICHNKFPNYSVLSKHFVQDHPDDKLYILCCKRRFHRRCHFVDHIRLHMDPNAFKCEICGKCSTNDRNLAKHIREMHTEEGRKQRPFECTVCQKSYVNKTVLRIHMESHDTNLNHICKECGKGFPSELRRNLHERAVHNADRICDQCGKTLHGAYALKKHLLEHAGVQKPKWPCDQCGAQLHSHCSLKRHKLLTHPDGSTVYVCSDCGKVCTTEMSLRSHKKSVHQTERKFKCTICDKSFKYPTVLREHMARHTGEDLYQCPHCPFKTNANMHYHRKKAHPKEWAETLLQRPQVTKVDLNLLSNEIVI